MRELTVEALEAVAVKAVQAGYFPSTWAGNDCHAGKVRRFLRWDVSGRCESPVPVELFARYSVTGNGHMMADGRKAKPMTVVLETRCRRCGWCRMQRRNLWAAKALTEYKEASRTWFLTLTMRPEEHYRMLSTARAAVADYDSLPHDKRFHELVRYCGREITLFIKRVRKNSRAKLRYMLVAEAHKSGLPHFHMLVFEKGAPVRKHVMKEAWRLGFSKIVLATDARGAMYLCKYLSKESSTRVRASFRFGQSKIDPLRSLEHSDSVLPPDPYESGGGRGIGGNSKEVSPVTGLTVNEPPGPQGPELPLYDWTDTVGEISYDEFPSETVNRDRRFSRTTRSDGSLFDPATVQERGVLEYEGPLEDSSPGPEPTFDPTVLQVGPIRGRQF